jgi:putative Mg2+ transporter-C (MgtC) family protein
MSRARANADAPPPGWLHHIEEAIHEASVETDAFVLETAAVRLGAALVFGGLVGLERERRHRPAGLRTHMLVSLASALFTIMALEIAAAGDRLGPNLRVDPTRVIEAVTAGVAFLAAGAIIRQGSSVKGLTTGAGLWMAGAVGVTCGLGFLTIAAGSVVVVVIVLSIIRLLEP